MFKRIFSKKLVRGCFLIMMIGGIGLVTIRGISVVVSQLATFKSPESETFKAEFINEISPSAQRSGKEHQMFPSIIIAQAILESDWGRSQLAKESNNLFGIKAGEGDDSQIILPTQEFEEGKMTTQDAAFKTYSSLDESIIDHGYFLTGATYQTAKVANDYKDAAKAIQAGGYATDPAYSDKLIAIIEEYDLYSYDAS